MSLIAFFNDSMLPWKMLNAAGLFYGTVGELRVKRNAKGR